MTNTAAEFTAHTTSNAMRTSPRALIEVTDVTRGSATASATRPTNVEC